MSATCLNENDPHDSALKQKDWKQMAALPDLETRRLEPELMDDPSLDAKEHERALRALARVHWLTGTTSRIWNKIDRAGCFRGEANRPIRVLDVGCGDGLLLMELYQKAEARGIKIQPIACDFSERALVMAQAKANNLAIPLITTRVDILKDPLPTCDVLINSLFLHHFEDSVIPTILRAFCRSAERLVVIEDLLRSNFGYALCWLGVHSLTRCKVVHVDGLLSVRAALTVDEMQAMMRAAEMDENRNESSETHHATLEKHWPERFIVTWKP